MGKGEILMWKKVLVLIICMAGCIFMVYAGSNGFMKNIINAQSAPTFQLPKGSKVVLGKYDNKEIVWDIGNHTSDYVLMSSKPIKQDFEKYSDSLGCTISNPSGTTPGVYYVKKCPNTLIDNEINSIVLSPIESPLLIRNAFIPTYHEIKTGGTLGLSTTDRAFKDINYYLNERGVGESSLKFGWNYDISTLIQLPQTSGTGNAYLSTGGLIPPADKIGNMIEYYWGGSASSVTLGNANIRENN